MAGLADEPDGVLAAGQRPADDAAAVDASDLEAAIRSIQPDATPLAVNLALDLERGTDGAMRHIVAFLLDLPPDES